jgi:hypothetical protein
MTPSNDNATPVPVPVDEDETTPVQVETTEELMSSLRRPDVARRPILDELYGRDNCDAFSGVDDRRAWKDWT